MRRNVWAAACVVSFGVAGVASAADPCFAWENAPPIPGLFNLTNLGYDAAREVAVAIGAINGVGVRTLELRHSGWTDVGPGPVVGFDDALVYDDARERMVLGYFTGAVGAIAEFDGTAWSGVLATFPYEVVNEENHRAAYDEARGVTTFLQLAVEGSVNITFTWDGAQLTQLAPVNSPPNLRTPAMCYDAAREVVLVFGGTVPLSNVATDQLWQWDGSDWTEIPRSGLWPSPRSLGSLVFDRLRNVAVLIGGTASDTNIIWEWNGAVWRQRSVQNPLSLQIRSSAAYEIHEDSILTRLLPQSSQRLTGAPEPWIVGHPQSVQAAVGSDASFAVSFGNDAQYDFQWRKDGVALPGQISANLVVEDVTLADAGVYDCVISYALLDSPCTTAVAGPAALTVVGACPEDINIDGAVNFADLNAVISAFNTTCP